MAPRYQKVSDLWVKQGNDWRLKFEQAMPVSRWTDVMSDMCWPGVKSEQTFAGYLGACTGRDVRVHMIKITPPFIIPYSAHRQIEPSAISFQLSAKANPHPD